jgi:hypothetical protein
VSELGGSEIRVLLHGVTDEQVGTLQEAFADVLVEHGFAGGDDVRAVVACRGYDWPDTPDEAVAEWNRDGWASILFPGAE